MATSASPISVPTFNGSSTFSSSFQQVLTRAVQQASLPMQQMQNNVSDLTSQQTALTQLESTFQSLDTALQNIGSASGGSPSASVSDPSVVSAATTSSALPGTYSIQVDSLGSYSTAMSQAGSTTVTDPTTQNISPASSFTLTVNGTNTTITPADSSLEGLASAINSSSAGVQATIVNLGSNSSPDYRLVVTSDSLGSLGSNGIQLSDGSSDLLGNVSGGAPATYQVNGSSTVLQSDSNQVTLSPGLTVTLLGTSSEAATITVSTDYSSLQSALSNFATAYNSAVGGVGQQIGQNAGALSGDSIVYTLNDVLQSISQYSSGSGAVASLNDLGLSVDSTGQMSFDASTFSAQSPTAVAQFLGSATAGGFMQAATNALSSVDDMNTGDLETEYSALQDQINQQNQLIQDEQTRISDMETNLENQLSQADAAIAVLQSQKTYYQDLFQAEYPATSSG
jgi:flagellar hook-associated protein 2